MPILINTRPTCTPVPVVDGVDVLNLPLLEITYLDSLDATAYQHMMDFVAGRLSTLLTVSAPAATAGVNFLKVQGIGHARDLIRVPHAVAVGDTTANILADFGFEVSVPTITHQNNEGMLQLPTIRGLAQGDSLIIWQGLGGRTHLKDVLSSRGVRILSVAWYERREPNTLATQMSVLANRVASADVLYVIISSHQSWLSWQRYVSKLNHHRCIYLTLGMRLYDIVGQSHPDERVLISDLTDRSLSCAILNFTHKA